jgi:carbamoyl-phosphate synthase/aspartate carbamoyltransferase
LTQHLANNLIDLYINLPSKNNYRRPASYTSKGYRTRRMAVDFAVPLITNVKCAKLFIEAIVRKMPLDVSNLDYKTSHSTYTFPGLVNIQAFIPGITQADSQDFMHVTKASVGAGFTTIQVIPYGVGGSVVDAESLDAAQGNARGAAHCNYAFSIAATSGNAKSLGDDVQAEVKSLFVPFNTSPLVNVDTVSSLAAHFAAWPADKPIVTDAKATDLASVLLLASLHNRGVHVTNVRSKDDVLLIALSKEKQLKVTCDVSVYSLFFTVEQYPKATCLPSAADQAVLWQHLDVVDIFSVGIAPYQLCAALGEDVQPWCGIDETLPLLLKAVSDGRLTLEGIKQRLHDNPIRIFDLPEQSHTQVEVIVDRKAPFIPRLKGWSPIDRQTMTGSVHRVVIHNQTVYLDGTSYTTAMGRDVSAAVPPIRSPDRNARLSFNAARRPSASGIRRPSISIGHRPVSPVVSASSGSPVLRSADHGGVALPSIMSLASTAPRQSSLSASSLGPLSPHPTFHRRHILSVKQFTHQDLHDLFNLAHEMRLQVERNGIIDILKGRVLCTLFYEPSTRTSSSFDAAMKRCGGEVVVVDAERSSVMKGESLADTVRTLGCYGDAIVLRHPAVGSAQSAAKYSPVPIINAGDGIGEHPTQVTYS